MAGDYPLRPWNDLDEIRARIMSTMEVPTDLLIEDVLTIQRRGDGKFFIDGKELDLAHLEEWGKTIVVTLAEKLLE